MFLVPKGIKNDKKDSSACCINIYLGICSFFLCLEIQLTFHVFASFFSFDDRTNSGWNEWNLLYVFFVVGTFWKFSFVWISIVNNDWVKEMCAGCSILDVGLKILIIEISCVIFLERYVNCYFDDLLKLKSDSNWNISSEFMKQQTNPRHKFNKIYKKSFLIHPTHKTQFCLCSNNQIIQFNFTLHALSIIMYNTVPKYYNCLESAFSTCAIHKKIFFLSKIM